MNTTCFSLPRTRPSNDCSALLGFGNAVNSTKIRNCLNRPHSLEQLEASLTVAAARQHEASGVPQEQRDAFGSVT